MVGVHTLEHRRLIEQLSFKLSVQKLGGLLSHIARIGGEIEFLKLRELKCDNRRALKPTPVALQ